MSFSKFLICKKHRMLSNNVVESGVRANVKRSTSQVQFWPQTTSNDFVSNSLTHTLSASPPPFAVNFRSRFISNPKPRKFDMKSILNFFPGRHDEKLDLKSPKKSYRKPYNMVQYCTKNCKVFNYAFMTSVTATFDIISTTPTDLCLIIAVAPFQRKS